ncbi:P-loop containing nucleoside triphosphate hydrolase protein [Piptocephalis cylindrospora]|uniref:RNA helicase n=1 Tax=Piptocephalis cylindrospora TaxID=1907219 RepID=A0A4P9YBJ0_9FUNG|nr:P-loop containing nucleoside triphosphate hydrolase protein [Piptocephalis cylindrospora]|eukprot:RKP15490.1 P-loop containing nucleoside triphosphate hydrolase protein [Piptocephalis cylindrospora]
MNTRQRAPPVPEDPARNQALKASWDRYKESQAGQKMMEARHRLPMVQHADELMKAVRESPVVVLVGQTGCGKTTQVPQLLLEDAINQGRGSSCRILCTQPRRLAAISVAERVARERGERVGSTAGVGYTVRFDARPPHPGGGTVQYCTTGVLLRRLHGAEGLEGVSHVVVDEVHERDMGVDFLLVVLRRLLASRVEAGLPAVKVILMSATVETGLFASYFSRVCGGQPAPIVRVPGRTFPVTRHLLGEVVEEMRERWGHRDVDRLLRAQDTSKYVDRELRVMSPAGSASEMREEAEVPYSLIAMSVAHIIRGDDEPDQGAILVFLPGWEEMSRVQRILQQDRPLGLDMSNESIYHIHLLHSSIPSKTQHLVFDPVPAGEWKIILATNIAETSITIDDVVWVVDSGKIREKRYDPATRITHLVTAWVSESSARQRAGRAGRVRPGHYYGCMSQGRYARLDPYGTPEMVRSDLQEICLHIRALELPGGSAAQLLAEALEPPDPSAVAAALANLRALRALDGEERLTPLGRVLATLPVEPTLGRMVLQGVVMRALDPALTLAAAMAGKDPFAGPAWKRQEGDAARSRWSRGTRSDLLAIAQVYEPWVEMMHAHGSVGEVIRFCEEESLGWQSLQAIDRTKTQLLDVLRRAGVLQAAMRHFPAPPPGTSRRKGLFLGPPELNSNSHSPALLRSLILSGVYPNVAIQRGDGRRKKDAGCVTRHVRWSLVHPSSVNSRRQLERADDAVASRSMDNDVSGSNGSVYVFSEVVQSAPAPGGGGGGGMSILRQTTRVSPATTLLFGGVVEEEMTPQGSLELLMDGWLRISGISPNIPAPSALVSRSSVLLALAAQVKWQMDRAFEKTFADMMCGPGESGSGEKSLFTQGHLVKLLIQTLEALDVRDGKD